MRRTKLEVHCLVPAERILPVQFLPHRSFRYLRLIRRISRRVGTVKVTFKRGDDKCNIPFPSQNYHSFSRMKISLRYRLDRCTYVHLLCPLKYHLYFVQQIRVKLNTRIKNSKRVMMFLNELHAVVISEEIADVACDFKDDVAERRGISN